MNDMTEDEQEAASLKYSRSLSILALVSGKFALFFPWSNNGGMPLAKIAEWAELEAEVRAWREKAEPSTRVETRKQDNINLEELFGSFGETENRGSVGVGFHKWRCERCGAEREFPSYSPPVNYGP